MSESTKTLVQIEEEWEKEGRYGSREERMQRTSRWLPYYALLAEKQKDKPFDEKEDPTGFIGILRETGCLCEGDEALDIGAGAGDYSLRFACSCRSVTALDPCGESLDILRHRAKEKHIENVRTVQASWESYEAEEEIENGRHVRAPLENGKAEDASFDLVFLSMCPVICNVEEIKRMEALSRRSCAIVTVMPGSQDEHRRAMMKEWQLHPAGMMTGAARYQEVLSAMGREVSVFPRTLSYRSGYDREAFCEKYTVYFSVFGLPREKTVPYLNDYFDRHAESGTLWEESRLNLALLTWPVR